MGAHNKYAQWSMDDYGIDTFAVSRAEVPNITEMSGMTQGAQLTKFPDYHASFVATNEYNVASSSSVCSVSGGTVVHDGLFKKHIIPTFVKSYRTAPWQTSEIEFFYGKDIRCTSKSFPPALLFYAPSFTHFRNWCRPDPLKFFKQGSTVEEQEERLFRAFKNTQNLYRPFIYAGGSPCNIPDEIRNQLVPLEDTDPRIKTILRVFHHRGYHIPGCYNFWTMPSGRIVIKNIICNYYFGFIEPSLEFPDVTVTNQMMFFYVNIWSLHILDVRQRAPIGRRPEPIRPGPKRKEQPLTATPTVPYQNVPRKLVREMTKTGAACRQMAESYPLMPYELQFGGFKPIVSNAGPVQKDHRWNHNVFVFPVKIEPRHVEFFPHRFCMTPTNAYLLRWKKELPPIAQHAYVPQVIFTTVRDERLIAYCSRDVSYRTGLAQFLKAPLPVAPVEHENWTNQDQVVVTEDMEVVRIPSNTSLESIGAGKNTLYVEIPNKLEYGEDEVNLHGNTEYLRFVGKIKIADERPLKIRHGLYRVAQQEDHEHEETEEATVLDNSRNRHLQLRTVSNAGGTAFVIQRRSLSVGNPLRNGPLQQEKRVFTVVGTTPVNRFYVLGGKTQIVQGRRYTAVQSEKRQQPSSSNAAAFSTVEDSRRKWPYGYSENDALIQMGMKSMRVSSVRNDMSGSSHLLSRRPVQTRYCHEAPPILQKETYTIPSSLPSHRLEPRKHMQSTAAFRRATEIDQQSRSVVELANKQTSEMAQVVDMFGTVDTDGSFVEENDYDQVFPAGDIGYADPMDHVSHDHEYTSSRSTTDEGQRGSAREGGSLPTNATVNNNAPSTSRQDIQTVGPSSHSLLSGSEVQQRGRTRGRKRNGEPRPKSINAVEDVPRRNPTTRTRHNGRDIETISLPPATHRKPQPNEQPRTKRNYTSCATLAANFPDVKEKKDAAALLLGRPPRHKTPRGKHGARRKMLLTALVQRQDPSKIKMEDRVPDDKVEELCAQAEAEGLLKEMANIPDAKKKKHKLTGPWSPPKPPKRLRKPYNKKEATAAIKSVMELIIERIENPDAPGPSNATASEEVAPETEVKKKRKRRKHLVGRRRKQHNVRQNAKAKAEARKGDEMPCSDDMPPVLEKMVHDSDDILSILDITPIGFQAREQAVHRVALDEVEALPPTLAAQKLMDEQAPISDELEDEPVAITESRIPETAILDEDVPLVDSSRAPSSFLRTHRQPPDVPTTSNEAEILLDSDEGMDFMESVPTAVKEMQVEDIAGPSTQEQMETQNSSLSDDDAIPLEQQAETIYDATELEKETAAALVTPSEMSSKEQMESLQSALPIVDSAEHVPPFKEEIFLEEETVPSASVQGALESLLSQVVDMDSLSGEQQAEPVFDAELAGEVQIAQLETAEMDFNEAVASDILFTTTEEDAEMITETILQDGRPLEARNEAKLGLEMHMPGKSVFEKEVVNEDDMNGNIPLIEKEPTTDIVEKILPSEEVNNVQAEKTSDASFPVDDPQHLQKEQIAVAVDQPILQETLEATPQMSENLGTNLSQIQVPEQDHHEVEQIVQGMIGLVEQSAGPTLEEIAGEQSEICQQPQTSAASENQRILVEMVASTVSQQDVFMEEPVEEVPSTPVRSAAAFEAGPLVDSEALSIASRELEIETRVAREPAVTSEHEHVAKEDVSTASSSKKIAESLLDLFDQSEEPSKDVFESVEKTATEDPTSIANADIPMEVPVEPAAQELMISSVSETTVPRLESQKIVRETDDENDMGDLSHMKPIMSSPEPEQITICVVDNANSFGNEYSLDYRMPDRNVLDNFNGQELENPFIDHVENILNETDEFPTSSGLALPTEFRLDESSPYSEKINCGHRGRTHSGTGETMTANKMLLPSEIPETADQWSADASSQNKIQDGVVGENSEEPADFDGESIFNRPAVDQSNTDEQEREELLNMRPRAPAKSGHDGFESLPLDEVGPLSFDAAADQHVSSVSNSHPQLLETIEKQHQEHYSFAHEQKSGTSCVQAGRPLQQPESLLNMPLPPAMQSEIPSVQVPLHQMHPESSTHMQPHALREDVMKQSHFDHPAKQLEMPCLQIPQQQMHLEPYGNLFVHGPVAAFNRQVISTAPHPRPGHLCNTEGLGISMANNPVMYPHEYHPNYPRDWNQQSFGFGNNGVHMQNQGYPMGWEGEQRPHYGQSPHFSQPWPQSNGAYMVPSHHLNQPQQLAWNGYSNGQQHLTRMLPPLGHHLPNHPMNVHPIQQFNPGSMQHRPQAQQHPCIGLGVSSSGYTHPSHYPAVQPQLHQQLVPLPSVHRHHHPRLPEPQPPRNIYPPFPPKNQAPVPSSSREQVPNIYATPEPLQQELVQQQLLHPEPLRASTSLLPATGCHYHPESSGEIKRFMTGPVESVVKEISRSPTENAQISNASTMPTYNTEKEAEDANECWLMSRKKIRGTTSTSVKIDAEKILNQRCLPELKKVPKDSRLGKRSPYHYKNIPANVHNEAVIKNSNENLNIGGDKSLYKAISRAFLHLVQKEYRKDDEFMKRIWTEKLAIHAVRHILDAMPYTCGKVDLVSHVVLSEKLRDGLKQLHQYLCDNPAADLTANVSGEMSREPSTTSDPYFLIHLCKAIQGEYIKSQMITCLQDGRNSFYAESSSQPVREIKSLKDTVQMLLNTIPEDCHNRRMAELGAFNCIVFTCIYSKEERVIGSHNFILTLGQLIRGKTVTKNVKIGPFRPYRTPESLVSSEKTFELRVNNIVPGVQLDISHDGIGLLYYRGLESEQDQEPYATFLCSLYEWKGATSHEDVLKELGDVFFGRMRGLDETKEIVASGHIQHTEDERDLLVANEVFKEFLLAEAKSPSQHEVQYRMSRDRSSYQIMECMKMMETLILNIRFSFIEQENHIKATKRNKSAMFGPLMDAQYYYIAIWKHVLIYGLAEAFKYMLSPTRIINLFDHFKDNKDALERFKQKIYGAVNAIFSRSRLTNYMNGMEEAISALNVTEGEKEMILKERALNILSRVFIPQKMFELDLPEPTSPKEARTFETKQAAMKPGWDCSARSNVVESKRFIMDRIYDSDIPELDNMFWQSTEEDEKNVLLDIITRTIDVAPKICDKETMKNITKNFIAEITGKTTPEMMDGILDSPEMSPLIEKGVLSMYCNKRLNSIGAVGLRTVKLLIPQANNLCRYLHVAAEICKPQEEQLIFNIAPNSFGLILNKLGPQSSSELPVSSDEMPDDDQDGGKKRRKKNPKPPRKGSKRKQPDAPDNAPSSKSTYKPSQGKHRGAQYNIPSLPSPTPSVHHSDAWEVESVASVDSGMFSLPSIDSPFKGARTSEQLELHDLSEIEDCQLEIQSVVSVSSSVSHPVSKVQKTRRRKKRKILPKSTFEDTSATKKMLLEEFVNQSCGKQAFEITSFLTLPQETRRMEEEVPLQPLSSKALVLTRPSSVGSVTSSTSSTLPVKEKAPNRVTYLIDALSDMLQTSEQESGSERIGMGKASEADRELSTVSQTTIYATENQKHSHVQSSSSAVNDPSLQPDSNEPDVATLMKETNSRHFYYGNRYNVNRSFVTKLVTITLSDRRARGKIALQAPSDEDATVHRLYTEGKSVMKMIFKGSKLDYEEMEQDWDLQHRTPTNSKPISVKCEPIIPRRNPSTDSPDSLVSFCQRHILPIKPICEAKTPPPRPIAVKKDSKPCSKKHPQYPGPVRIITKAALKELPPPRNVETKPLPSLVTSTENQRNHAHDVLESPNSLQRRSPVSASSESDSGSEKGLVIDTDAEEEEGIPMEQESRNEDAHERMDESPLHVYSPTEVKLNAVSEKLKIQISPFPTTSDICMKQKSAEHSPIARDALKDISAKQQSSNLQLKLKTVNKSVPRWSANHEVNGELIRKFVVFAEIELRRLRVTDQCDNFFRSTRSIHKQQEEYQLKRTRSSEMFLGRSLRDHFGLVWEKAEARMKEEDNAIWMGEPDRRQVNTLFSENCALIPARIEESQSETSKPLQFAVHFPGFEALKNSYLLNSVDGLLLVRGLDLETRRLQSLHKC